MKLFEIRSAPLYHWMNSEKADAIFKSDAFDKLWEHDTKEGKLKGTSFSRNAKFNFGEKPIRLTFDQTKLASRFKIVPLDAERAFHHSMKYDRFDKMKDRKINSDHGQQYAEEFVVGPIKDVHKYITKIELMDRVTKSSSKFPAKHLIEDAIEYAKKWKIPIEMTPVVKKFLEAEELDESGSRYECVLFGSQRKKPQK